MNAEPNQWLAKNLLDNFAVVTRSRNCSTWNNLAKPPCAERTTIARGSPLYSPLKIEPSASENELSALAVIQNEKGETMSQENAAAFTRKQLIDNLNEDLSREYQAIIAYVNYSQVLTGAAYMSIAQTLVIHAGEELAHALKIANAIDYLGGMPSVTPKPVKTSEKAEEMLRFDLDNETDTIRNYRRRVKQADLLNEYAIAETIRSILVEEQDHLVELATALGIDPPDPGIAD